MKGSSLQSVCSDSASCEISASLLGGCIEEAYQAEVIAVKRQESQPSGHPQVCLYFNISFIPYGLYLV